MEYVFSNISDLVIFSPHNCNLELILKSIELYSATILKFYNYSEILQP